MAKSMQAEQAEEAQRIAKDNTAAWKKMAPRVRKEKLASMNRLATLEFLDSLSSYEREQYLEAEKVGEKRLDILGYYGWTL